MNSLNKIKDGPEKYSISRYFIISVFVIAALLVVIPLTTIYMLTRAYDGQIRSETQQTSFAIQQTVQSFVESAYKLSEELAVNPSILSMNGELLADILADSVSRNDYMLLLYVTGMDGMQIARSSGTLGDRSGRFWYIQMMETNQPFVSPSYYSVTTKMPCTSIFMPMYNYNNPEKMIGVFGADIDLVYLQRLTEQFANPDNGRYSFIIDGEGVVIAHPDSEYLENLTNYKTLIRTVSVTDTYGRPILNPDTSVVTKEEEVAVSNGFRNVISAVMSGAGGLDIAEYNGVDYYMSYEPITIPGYSDSWSVVTLQDRSAAMSTASRLLIQVIIIIVMILAIFVVLIAGFFKTLRKTMTHLEIANERFRLILDSMPLICNLWSKDGRVIDCNEAALKLFDIKDKETYMARFLELAPEYQADGKSTADLAREVLDKAFTEGACYFEYMAQRLDGTPIPQGVTLTRVAYGGDYIAVGYGRDLREQRKMMHELESAQITTFAMFDANPQVNVLFDSKFNIVDCNPAAIDFIGFKTREEMMAGFGAFVKQPAESPA